ncbi:alpha-amylase family protein [Paenibacillus senegalensis]|uniref:alpha-amylase family protein n=1 Tax=Paenibacillus senegalensis TaxID=1465766 RepID=UPI0002885B8A|nr:alpha-amylase family protein [Paenibacillus senegalensis]
MKWWERNNLRLIQTNLREVDAAMDVDRLIHDLQKFSANVLMMNAGGIFAFYPTKLEYHYQTPYLTTDLLGEALEKTHKAGMKFIARFDFSKAHESLFARRPEWFYRTREGREVNYNGIVHTCINGGYQQQYALQILEEVITGYPVDGIFFNMFGYQTSDYSSNDYGICHCHNCRERFAALHGMELPGTRDPEDPRYAAYRRFQWDTTRDMLERIHDFVKKLNPDLAISTYNEYKVDIVRKESNTKLTRPHPVWLYSSSENVKSVQDSWDNKIISNCCINAVDLPYRFMGVAPEEVAIRLYESIACGSGLDFCIIGVFDGYTDHSSFPIVQEIFRFHKENERYFGQLQSMARIALVKPSGAQGNDIREYLGIFKMLKESHIPFDVIVQHQLPDHNRLSSYQLLILPDIRGWEPEQLNVLKELQCKGVRLAATGLTLASPEETDTLRELFDAEVVSVTEDTDAAYLDCSDWEFSADWAGREWVFITGAFAHVRFGAMTSKRLPYLPPANFGPPERAYGHRRSDFCGAGLALKTASHEQYAASGEEISVNRSQSGEAKALYIPWQPGKQYYLHGYEDHKRITLGLLKELNAPYHISAASSDVPSSVELFVNLTPEKQILVQFLNLSGFNGVTYGKPLPVGPLRVMLDVEVGLPERAYSLKTGQEIRLLLDESKQRVTVELDELNTYDAILLE